MLNNIVRQRLVRSDLIQNTSRLFNTFSNSAAYQGDGKTTVRVLNNNVHSALNLINTYSASGFRLSNNVFVTGSIICFPTNVFSWTVERGKDITIESLLLFDLIVPKVKLLIIGYGDHGEAHDHSIPLIMKRKGISCEMVETPHAISTYNYMASDGVQVAGCFVPVKEELLVTADEARNLHMPSAVVGELHEKVVNDHRYNLDYRQKAMGKIRKQTTFDD